MKIHVWERAFLAAGATVLVACGAALIYVTVGMDIHLPGDHGRVDPARLAETPPFDAPGVRQLDDGRWEAVVIGRTWTFEPAEIRVPAGVEVVFTATSADVLHGFNIEGTRMNLMLIPGQISQNTYTFDEPGEYLLICHEYCGIGHHFMAGRVIVEEGPTVATSESPEMEVR
ncbi:MAG: cytochrome c oxidase subunit II [Gemmatimonadota bacterium]